MDRFLYWSGAVAWGLFGVAAILVASDWAIEWAIHSFWTKREFLAFVLSRLKKQPGYTGLDIVKKPEGNHG